MTVETEGKLLNKERKLRKAVVVLEKLVLEESSSNETFNLEEIENINQSLDVLKSKKRTLTLMRKELEGQRIYKEKVAIRELVKLRRTLFKNKVNEKSKTGDIRKEIERLNRVYTAHKEDIKRLERSIPLRSNVNLTKDITNKIKMLTMELNHRISGFNKPVRIIQGGNTGLKK